MRKNIKNVHFLGIGGISQSAIALIMKSKGYFVSGSDKVLSKTVKRLQEEGIDICIDGLSQYIEKADLVVVSAAVREDDKELMFAKSLGIEVISRAKMLGELASWYKNVISVAGSHGKTTTTGMITQIFIDAGLNPTVHIGGELACINGNVRVGGETFFVTEACEYVDSYLELKSDVSVVLNIQSDHLDYFKSFANINKSFKKFASHTKKGGLVVYLGDDKNANKHYREKSVSFSMQGKGVLEAKNVKQYEKGKYKFDCYFLGIKLMNIKLGVFGLHNVYNALASIAVALRYGIDFKIIKSALYNFRGVKRRFEDYGSHEGIKIIHDYAHHPTEIKATIDIAKYITENQVYVVFQPHTYSRTALLINEFKECFKGVKETLVYKVYPARESPADGIDQKELARQISMSGDKAFSFEDYKEMKAYLKSKLKAGDILLILGAGDIESFAEYYSKKDL